MNKYLPSKKLDSLVGSTGDSHWHKGSPKLFLQSTSHTPYLVYLAWLLVLAESFSFIYFKGRLLGTKSTQSAPHAGAPPSPDMHSSTQIRRCRERDIIGCRTSRSPSPSIARPRTTPTNNNATRRGSIDILQNANGALVFVERVRANMWVVDGMGWKMKSFWLILYIQFGKSSGENVWSFCFLKHIRSYY